jgi:Leucine-rich repeat (LRR) protein
MTMPCHSAILAGLLGVLLIGCEKIPTFQELTGQEAAKDSTAVVNPKSSSVAPITPPVAAKSLETQQPSVPEDPTTVMAVLTRKSTGQQLTNQDLARATKLPSILAELKSLDASRSMVNDEGLLLLSQFTALTQIDLASIQINGSGLEGLVPLAELRDLSLSSIKMDSSDGWEHLGKLPQVEKLNLSFSNITDASIPTLISMAGLKELNISNTAMTDDALVQLAKKEGLEILRMETTPNINGSGLKAFVQGKQSGLRCLYASGTSLSREGLGHVKKIESLEVFENNGAQLTDQLLAELKGATNIKTLAVKHNRLTAASGQTLRTLKKLEHLDLAQNNAIDTQILAVLMSMTDLRTLDVTKTNCSRVAVQEFRQKRKKCQVTFDDNVGQ